MLRGAIASLLYEGQAQTGVKRCLCVRKPDLFSAAHPKKIRHRELLKKRDASGAKRGTQVSYLGGPS